MAFIGAWLFLRLRPQFQRDVGIRLFGGAQHEDLPASKQEREKPVNISLTLKVLSCNRDWKLFRSPGRNTGIFFGYLQGRSVAAC